MNYRFVTILFLAACIALAAFQPVAFAQLPSQDASRDSLRGLKGLRVTIDPLPLEADKAGLDRTTLQTDTELKLRTAGVPVLAGERAFETPLDAYLQIRLVLVPGRFRTWAYSLSMQLVQPAKLNNGLTAFASTWQRGEVGLLTTGKLPTLRTTASDMANMFVNDYLAANQAVRAPELPAPTEAPRGIQD